MHKPMFDEDLYIFFDDFATEFVWQGQTGRGIFNAATYIVSANVLSVNDMSTTLTIPYGYMPGIKELDMLTIGDTALKMAR